MIMVPWAANDPEVPGQEFAKSLSVDLQAVDGESLAGLVLDDDLAEIGGEHFVSSRGIVA